MTAESQDVEMSTQENGQENGSAPNPVKDDDR